MQLARGRPTVNISQVDLDGPVLSTFGTSTRLKCEFTLEPGWVWLVLKRHRGVHTTWNGQTFPDWGVALLRGDNDFDILHEANYAAFEMHFPAKLFTELGLAVTASQRSGAQLSLSAREGGHLVRCLGSLLQAAGTEGRSVLSRAAARQRVVAIAAGLLDQLAAATEQPIPHKLARTRVANAERLIEEQLEDPPDLPTLARSLGVSPPTLRREFLKVLGTSPKAYVLARRLRAAKEELRKGSRTTVTDVSIKFGFSHPSRFAEHYKRHFGECPSTVLRTGLA